MDFIEVFKYTPRLSTDVTHGFVSGATLQTSGFLSSKSVTPACFQRAFCLCSSNMLHSPDKFTLR